MPQSFSAQVSKWVLESEQRLDAVFKQSAQDVADEMTRPVGAGGRMPVDTGFLRASLQASTTEMPLIDRDARPSAGQTYQDSASQITLVIANAKLGDPIFLGFSASYSQAVEFGARGRPPAGFVRGAADQWQSIVNRNAAEARRRAGR